MIKELEDVNSTKKRLTLVISAAEIEEEMTVALNDVRIRTRISGYRQGKAPISLIEKRYGKDVEGEVVERLVQRTYAAALEEASLKPVASPAMEGGLDFGRGRDLTLTFTVEVMPKLNNLSYDKVQVNELDVAIADQDVDLALERVQAERSKIEPTDEPVVDGCLVVFDYTAQAEGEDAPREYKDEVFKVGTDLMPAAFTAALTGRKKGEAAEFEAEFPAEYPVTELAGRKHACTLTLKDIKKIVMPAMDDEFAVGLGFDDLPTLKEHARGRLEEARKQSVARVQKAQLLKKLIEAHEFDAPVSFVDDELENLMARARSEHNTTMTQVMRASGEEGAEAKVPAFDEARVKEEFRPNAERNVRGMVLLQLIADAEKIEVTETDLRQRIEALSERTRMTPENLLKYYTARDGSFDGLKREVMEDKVLDLLLARAEVVPAATEDKG